MIIAAVGLAGSPERLRVIIAAILTVAIAVGLAGSSTWQPGRHLRGAPETGPAFHPKGVITQARTRQRRRRAKIAATAAALGAEVAGRVIGSGSPPQSRRRSRPHGQGGGPVPAPQAERLPGLPAQFSAAVAGLSCPAARNCAIDGTYGGNDGEMFVANEVNGRWDKAETILGYPGTDLQAAPLSCSKPENCLAAGYYQSDNNGKYSGAFTVAEKNGIWGKMRPIWGIPRVKRAMYTSQVDSVSCASVDNCAVGGFYHPAGAGPEGMIRPFVASEINGRWSKAQPVQGLPALPSPWLPEKYSVSNISCASANNCTAGGGYAVEVQKKIKAAGVFVVSEKNGVWGRAEVLGGIAGQLPDAVVSQISCASGGNCGLIGESEDFYLRATKPRVFLASQVNGRWGDSEPIRGITSGNVFSGGLSCLAPRECTAVGSYGYGGAWADNDHSLSVTEIDGTWRGAQEVHGIQPVSPYGIWFNSMSCTSIGNCVAGGEGINPSRSPTVGLGSLVAATATEIDGTWYDAQEVRGIAAVNPGDGNDGSSEVVATSCPPGGPCVSAGTYQTPGPRQVFVVG